jgi:hypothetical protein
MEMRRMIMMTEIDPETCEGVIKSIETALVPLQSCKNSAEVAAFLASKGIKGYRANCGSCPISNYIHSECKFLVTVWTGAHYISHKNERVIRGFSRKGGTGKVVMSKVIDDFVNDFDRGNFDELELPRLIFHYGVDA